MLIIKTKRVLPVLVVTLAFAGIGAAASIGQTQAVEQPQTKEEQAGKADQDRIVGNWSIVNDDSKRKEEMWVISEDRVLMYAKHSGANAHLYSHRLDASKDPKQIDITVTRVKGSPSSPIGVIKGIYALDGDELRLCLAEIGKDRPATFPEKPGPGELLILHRQKPGASPPKPKEEQPAKTDQERMVGAWVIVKNDGERKRTGEGWLISKDEIFMNPTLSGLRVILHFHRLDAGKNPKQIDITVTKTNKEHVGIIKGIYAFDSDTELRLCLGEIGKERPTAFAGKPGHSEFLILHGGDPAARKRKVAKEEKLRMLIDKVLEAQGGEDKLSKLQFTMTVKHSNGETQHYFVQPPKSFRWETTHRDQTGKRIVILFPEGRRWWTKEPNADAKEFIPTGLEPLSVEGWFDYVKFFGPRQVLRLKDADHKVKLLDEETKIGERAAVGVQVTGPHYDHKMHFDKETHLLLKGIGSDILREVTFSDYKEFDGIPIALKEHDGHFDPEVTDFKAVDKFDARLFDQP